MKEIPNQNGMGKEQFIAGVLLGHGRAIVESEVLSESSLLGMDTKQIIQFLKFGKRGEDFEFDKLGRLTKIDHPDSSYEAYDYDNKLYLHTYRNRLWSLTGSALKLQIKLFSKEVIISNPPKRLSLNYKNWKYIQKIF